MEASAAERIRRLSERLQELSQPLKGKTLEQLQDDIHRLEKENHSLGGALPQAATSNNAGGPPARGPPFPGPAAEPQPAPRQENLGLGGAPPRAATGSSANGSPAREPPTPEPAAQPQPAPAGPRQEFTITRDHNGLAGYHIPDEGDLAVGVVNPDGPAYRAGMREGHVDWIITHVEGLEVTAETGRAVLDATRGPGNTFTIQVKRPDKDWSAANAFQLCSAEGSVNFKGKVRFMDKARFSSPADAVNKLNEGCTEEKWVALFAKGPDCQEPMWWALYNPGRKEEALRHFGVEDTGKRLVREESGDHFASIAGNTVVPQEEGGARRLVAPWTPPTNEARPEPPSAEALPREEGGARGLLAPWTPPTNEARPEPPAAEAGDGDGATAGAGVDAGGNSGIAARADDDGGGAASGGDLRWARPLPAPSPAVSAWSPATIQPRSALSLAPTHIAGAARNRTPPRQTNRTPPRRVDQTKASTSRQIDEALALMKQLKGVSS